MSDTTVKAPAAPAPKPAGKVREWEERGGFGQHGTYSRVIKASDSTDPNAQPVSDDTQLSDWERAERG